MVGGAGDRQQLSEAMARKNTRNPLFRSRVIYVALTTTIAMSCIIAIN